MSIFYLVLFIVVPFLIEQYVYWRTSKRSHPAPETTSVNTVSGYGWAYLWDFSQFVLFLYIGYRFIGQADALHVFDALGLGVFVAGVALRIWALSTLGEFYSSDIAFRGDHQVVTWGPYHYIRHPLHLGTNLEIIGMAFLAPFWLSLPLIGACFILTVYRNHSEDIVLIKNLGEPYAAFYRKTWDFVDMLYKKEDVLKKS